VAYYHACSMAIAGQGGPTPYKIVWRRSHHDSYAHQMSRAPLQSVVGWQPQSPMQVILSTLPLARPSAHFLFSPSSPSPCQTASTFPVVQPSSLCLHPLPAARTSPLPFQFLTNRPWKPSLRSVNGSDYPPAGAFDSLQRCPFPIQTPRSVSLPSSSQLTRPGDRPSSSALFLDAVL
jgi:hypothetical protein